MTVSVRDNTAADLPADFDHALLQHNRYGTKWS